MAAKKRTMPLAEKNEIPGWDWFRAFFFFLVRTIGWCQQREKIEWQQPRKFDCRLVRRVVPAEGQNRLAGTP